MRRFWQKVRPFTLTTPKPLLRIKEVTMLERCINLIIEYGVKKILLNTFHLENQIIEFIKNKKFRIDIRVIKDGRKILDTGGGILNMIENSQENDFIIYQFNFNDIDFCRLKPNFNELMKEKDYAK